MTKKKVLLIISYFTTVPSTRDESDGEALAQLDHQPAAPTAAPPVTPAAAAVAVFVPLDSSGLGLRQ